MAENRDLVEGEILSPFGRVALAADFASPFANAGDARLNYINSDATVYLHRLPLTEWIGFHVVNHQATDSVAIGECWLYDEAGAIGAATVAALARDGKRLAVYPRRRRRRGGKALCQPLFILPSPPGRRWPKGSDEGRAAVRGAFSTETALRIGTLICRFATSSPRGRREVVGQIYDQ
jgi:hypothetical protein